MAKEFLCSQIAWKSIQTVNPTEMASFGVTATDAGLTYQWRRNGVTLRNDFTGRD